MTPPFTHAERHDRTSRLPASNRKIWFPKKSAQESSQGHTSSTWSKARMRRQLLVTSSSKSQAHCTAHTHWRVLGDHSRACLAQAVATWASGTQKPTVAKRLAKPSTSAFSFKSLPGGLSFSTFLNSTSLGPLCFWTSLVTSIASAINSPMRAKSSSIRPREVMAGVPTRRPLGFMALLSPGMVFLLRTMDDCSQTSSDLLPLTPLERRSRRTRWLSVPPETRLTLRLLRDSPKACAFFMTCSWYARNSADCAIFNATARAVMDWLWGPPWRPGKTAALIFSSRSYMMGLPFLSTLRWPLR
mmetsp:Transcript_92371/g.270382  ORF Transcript_92371/g.270382 Transcript_92371/m.270382 type:complete len:301 (+) Transcript_92371:53-955(+)